MVLLILYTVKLSNNIGTRVIQTGFSCFSSHLLKLFLIRYTVPDHQADDLLCMKSVGGGAVSKKSFSALRASVWSKNKGGRAPQSPPLDPPLLLEQCLMSKVDLISLI